MQPLLRLAGWIDALNERIGKLAIWLVLLCCLISAGNAVVRYAVNYSSNGWLEIQWYIFTGLVLLGAPYTLRMNEHVRVDLIYGKLSPRGCAWVDLIGTLVFLMPAMLMTCWMAWPFFVDAWHLNEYSSNPGGLIRWPVKLLLPLGFGLLILQGVAEMIKRIGFLRGQFDMNVHYERPQQ